METSDNDKQEENSLMLNTESGTRRPPPVVAKKPKPPVAKKPPVAQKPAHLARSPSSLDEQDKTVSPPKAPPTLPKSPPKAHGEPSPLPNTPPKGPKELPTHPQTSPRGIREPPPLPKTPPKGHGEPSPLRTSPPRGQGEPHPLPRTPPKGSRESTPSKGDVKTSSLHQTPHREKGEFSDQSVTQKPFIPKQKSTEASDKRTTPSPVKSPLVPPKKLTKRDSAQSDSDVNQEIISISNSEKNGILPDEKQEGSIISPPKTSPRPPPRTVHLHPETNTIESGVLPVHKQEGDSRSPPKTSPRTPRTSPRKSPRNIQKVSHNVDQSASESIPMQKPHSTHEHPSTIKPMHESNSTSDNDLSESLRNQDSAEISERSVEDLPFKGPQRFNPFDKAETKVALPGLTQELDKNLDTEKLSEISSELNNVNTSSKGEISCDKTVNEPLNCDIICDSSVFYKLDNSSSSDNNKIDDKSHIWKKERKEIDVKSVKINESSVRNKTDSGSSASNFMSKIQTFLHKSEDSSTGNKKINKSNENLSHSPGETESKSKHKDWMNFFKNKKNKTEVKSERLSTSFVSYLGDREISAKESESKLSGTECVKDQQLDKSDTARQSAPGQITVRADDISRNVSEEVLSIFNRNSPLTSGVSDDQRRNSLPAYPIRCNSHSPVSQSNSVPGRPLPAPRRISPNRPRPVPRKRLSLSHHGSQTSISETEVNSESLETSVVTANTSEQNVRSLCNEVSRTLEGKVQSSSSKDKVEIINNCESQVSNVQNNVRNIPGDGLDITEISNESVSKEKVSNTEKKDFVKSSQVKVQSLETHEYSNIPKSADLDSVKKNDFVKSSEVKVQSLETHEYSNIQKSTDPDSVKSSKDKLEEKESDHQNIHRVQKISATSEEDNLGNLKDDGYVNIQDEHLTLKGNGSNVEENVKEFNKVKSIGETFHRDNVHTEDNNTEVLRGEIRDLKDQPKARSFDLTLLSDEPLMETSSLLDEIEQLVSRRLSELGPEFAYQVHKTSDPIPPPRTKHKNRRSQTIDVVTTDSDPLSCSDSSHKGSNSSLNSDLHGPTGVNKRQCPPKPKRTKLVNRSQSDVCGMKQLSLLRNEDMSTTNGVQSASGGEAGQNTPPQLPRRHLTVDFCVPANQAALIKQLEIRDKQNGCPPGANSSVQNVTSVNPRNSVDGDQSLDNKIKKLRPTRRAPPPPGQTGNKNKKGDKRNSLPNVPNYSAGYHSIKRDTLEKYYSVNHDYHEIPDDVSRDAEDFGSSLSLDNSANHHEKSPSPPELPPRNLGSSPPHQHFLNGRPISMASLISSSSNSGSIGSPEQDESTSSDSDGEDDEEKIMKSELETAKIWTSLPDIHIENAKGDSCARRSTPDKIFRHSIIGTRLSGLKGVPHLRRCSSELSITSYGSTVSSNVSSLSNIDDISSSSDSENDIQIELKRKKEKKVFFIANEIVSSEKVFVDVLKLLNLDFRVHISKAAESQQKPVIANEVLNKILNYLPQLQNFNEDLLHDLEERISHWEEHKKVADIFVKKGPFLKLYTSYIKDFEDMTTTLDEACKKIPLFHAAVKSFEASPRCANLALKHYMLKPIQRIPQYKLLLRDYRKHLSPSSPDYEDTNTALDIVSEVADHANESMRHGDQVHKLLEIQRSLDGNFEVIKPGRVLLKQGELMKLSRKEMQPRVFFLFNDVLLYTTPMATGGYKLNNALTLAGMKVTKANLDEFKNEFNIISVQRSFTVEARTPEERDEWLSALNSAIDENAQRRGTFESVKAGMETSFLDKDFVLGSKAPIWVPDTRVTMCMNCTGEFTVAWRRHHCRACGRVVCANCSDNRAPLEYLRNKPARVCDDCYNKLKEDFDKKAGGCSIEVVPDNMDQDGSILSFSSLKERFSKIRRSARLGHKFGVHRPSRLREVHASDQGSSMSGNLKVLKGRKWKKFWFVIKERVLYTYKASADMAAIDSMPVVGYEVVRFTESFEGVVPALLFQLNHKNRPPFIFQTESTNSTERWVKAMKEASLTDEAK